MTERLLLAIRGTVLVFLLDLDVSACSHLEPPNQAGEPAEGPAPEAVTLEPAVRYVGRFDARDPAGPRLGWTGERVIIPFHGSSVTASVVEKTRYPDGSRYDAIVDGQSQPTPLVLMPGPTSRVLAQGLTDGPHIVELRRRTEGQVGSTQFTGFDLGGGWLLPPPTPPSRRIEFLGDSESDGYGIECTNPKQSFSPATQNERKAFPALITESLSAEHSNVSFSGKGITRNYDSSDHESFATLYARALPQDPSSTWSFTPFVPDLVFVALGSNDWSTDDRPPPDPSEFKAKYDELIELVRAKNPGAQIMCVVEADITDVNPPGWNAYTNVTTTLKAVVADRTSPPISDTKVHYYELPRSDASPADGAANLTGCDGHPNEAFHRKAAADASSTIRRIMGW